MASAAQAIARARSQVGTKESPPGSNQTPYNTWYAGLVGNAYFRACAWCAIFQCWVLYLIGCLTRGELSAGAWALVDGLVREGRGLSKPVPGALIAFNYGSGHVELIVALDPDPNYVFTVGGNTGDGNPADGDGVYARRRYLGGGAVHSIAMPHYDDQTPATAPAQSSTGANAGSTPGKLVVDGSWGTATTMRLQQFLNAVAHAGLTVDGGLGPQTKMALQRWLGVTADGVIGKVTVTTLQHRVGASPDGVLGHDTVTALQRYLNSH